MSQIEILLVEDHEDTRRAMALLLKKEGFQVVEAATGSEGIARLDGQAIALLDVNLPDISGVEVFQHIRSQNHHTSIAFVTATGHPELLDRLNSMRVEAIFIKPVDFNKLVLWIKAELRADAK